MAFRKTISQDELRQKLTAEERENGPVYQPSRGGWMSKSQPKETPGAGNGTRGRLFGGRR
ncbi:hypothetical protein [Streptomyces fradiae]|uniref:hypothetical protein n=1 Tax=Streptomyces fradiae TaxID=1906 RepID=UPI0033D73136